MSEKLTPERAVRLLRAKTGELEASVLALDADRTRPATSREVSYLAADIALVAGLLADFIERHTAVIGAYERLGEAYIAATNPGIDMTEVREFRKGFAEGRPAVDDANVRDMREGR